MCVCVCACVCVGVCVCVCVLIVTHSSDPSAPKFKRYIWFFQVSLQFGCFCLLSSNTGQFSRICSNVSCPSSHPLHCSVSHFPVLYLQYRSFRWCLERSLLISSWSFRLRLSSVLLLLGDSSFGYLLMSSFVVSWGCSAICSKSLTCSASLPAFFVPVYPHMIWAPDQERGFSPIFVIVDEWYCLFFQVALGGIGVAELFQSIYYVEWASDDFQRFERVFL